MDDLTKLTITVDIAEVRAATEALEKLAVAAERASAAIASVGKQQHGGITLEAVGDVSCIDIRPLLRPAGQRRTVGRS